MHLFATVAGLCARACTAGRRITLKSRVARALLRHRGMNELVTTLRCAARFHPERVVWRAGHESLSSAELDRVSDERAAALRREGVKGGDRVLVHIDDDLERVASLLAVLKVGAVPVVLWTREVLGACLRHVQPRFALVEWTSVWWRWQLRGHVERVLLAGEVAFDDDEVPSGDGDDAEDEGWLRRALSAL